jgi:hypothetical protein
LTLFLRDEAGWVLSDWLLIPGDSFGPERDYLYAGDRLALQLDSREGVSPVRLHLAVDHIGSVWTAAGGGRLRGLGWDWRPTTGLLRRQVLISGCAQRVTLGARRAEEGQPDRSTTQAGSSDLSAPSYFTQLRL